MLKKEEKLFYRLIKREKKREKEIWEVFRK